MRNALSIKLLLLLATTFSLAAISGPIASNSHLLPISVPSVRANPAPAENWYPAGPAMDTLKFNIYTDTATMDTAFQAQQVDISDEPIASTTELNCLLTGGTGCTPGAPGAFSVTSPIGTHQYFEVQFDLSNQFWNCQMSFGNSPCGVNIRQAIAHLVDKNIFATTAPGINLAPLDNPDPPSIGLPIANACSWDPLFPETAATPNGVGICSVGGPLTGNQGGVSYHLESAGASGTGTPLFPWEPKLGSPDFCAAATHLIAAFAGGSPALLLGKSSTGTCALASLSGGVAQTSLNSTALAAIAAHTVNMMTRSSQPRHTLGNGLAEEICALFTGSFLGVGPTQCPLVSTTNAVLSGDVLTQTVGPITSMPGFVTSAGSTINNDWWMYTAGFINVQPFDTFYGIYDSIFASNNGPAGAFGVGDVPPCSTSSVPTGGASDYMYNCQATYDQLANLMEFAACLGSPGPAPDPTPGVASPTFASCTGTAVAGLCNSTTNCSAVSAGYQVEDLHGQTVVTLPVFGSKDQDGYLSNLARVIPSATFGIANFYTWLNAWTSTPAAAGALLQNCPSAPAVIGPDCIRSAMSQNTDGLNPYTSNSFWDAMVMGNIWDSLIAVNPLNTAQLIAYMTTGFPAQLPNSALGYTPAAGTTTSFRFTLRNDLFFHDSTPLTAFDVKYSYITFKASGGPASVGLVQMTDVHVLSTTTFDVNLSTFGPFTLNSIGASSILPGRLWSKGGSTLWDSALAACKTSTTPDACFTSTAAGQGNDPNAFTAATGVTSPHFDPLGAGILIGSSAWQCAAVPGLSNPSGHAIGGGCSSTGLENPGVSGYYQLTAFGAGTTPGTGVPSGQYFRSSGKLAVYIWSGNNGGSTHDFINSSTVASCFLKAVGTASCTQWQKGIVNPSATGAPVGFLQVSGATAFNGVHWTAPKDYLPGITYACCPFTANAPDGVAPLPLLLYAGVSNGNSGNPFASGAQEILAPAATALCTAAYPVGGYDC